MTDAPSAEPNGSAAETRQDPPAPEPSARRNRPLALLLQAGAIATAIGSISALVFGVVHVVSGRSGGGHAASSRPEHVRLSLPRPSIHPMTFRDYLTSSTPPIDPKYAPRNQLDDVGVRVDYELTTSGYPAGSSFPVRFRVLREAAGEEQLVDEVGDVAKLEVDSDSCSCTSPFIRIPRTKAKYRIEVWVFRPGRKTHSPLQTATSETFRGFGYVK